MNIKQAKDYIKECIKIYLKKDEFDQYRIPVMRQRPVFLLGPPGIGKTAVMEQIAEELGLALVSYSMTHHTRQSALGLPFICKREYEGTVYDVSEYTMSEIIATVYHTMKESGIKEGILFLDEINCVSETLAPAMLQFLQYKVFGQHKVPEGWVVVTAGNPPEYNKSVREFDVVTYDRLKVLEVEADYDTWRAYASAQGVHGAILNYLELEKEHFYRIEATVKGKSYVTARGWQDLSEMLKLYEEEGLTVEEGLVSQYIRNERIAAQFTAYYELYNKYRQEYEISLILEGKAGEKVKHRMKEAPFDERLSLVGMLTDKILGEMRESVETADYLTELTVCLKAVKALCQKGEKSVEALLKEQQERVEKRLESLKKANSLSEKAGRRAKRVIRFLRNQGNGAQKDFSEVERIYRERVERMKNDTVVINKRLHALFAFLEEEFPQGNEMLIFVTNLTVNDDSARFIGMFGSPDYRRYEKELMISERRIKLQKEIEALGL